MRSSTKTIDTYTAKVERETLVYLDLEEEKEGIRETERTGSSTSSLLCCDLSVNRLFLGLSSLYLRCGSGLVIIVKWALGLISKECSRVERLEILHVAHCHELERSDWPGNTSVERSNG